MPINLTTQTLVCAAFLILGIAFLNPLHLWMTTSFHMFLLALLVVVFGIFATLLIQERGGDERTEAHRMLAGRSAFLAGAAVLLAGIVWQAFFGIVDPWLVLTLCVMVLAKTAARYYGEHLL